MAIAEMTSGSQQSKMPTNMAYIGKLSSTQNVKASVTLSDSYDYILILPNDGRISSNLLMVQPAINDVILDTFYRVTDGNPLNTSSGSGLILLPYSVSSGDVFSVTPKGGGTTTVWVYGVQVQ